MYEPPVDPVLDNDRIAEVALALLSLTKHDKGRVWKGMHWDIMEDLFERGWISDPRSKARSVVLSKEAEELADQFLIKYFKKDV